jgi:two-component system, chemotaxis family, chemotaxis protein CheY
LNCRIFQINRKLSLPFLLYPLHNQNANVGPFGQNPVFADSIKKGGSMTENLEQKKTRSPLRILVVEDSDLLRQIFGTALGKEHLIETAPNTKEGWDLYLKRSPNIVFVDILLPDGNGHDLAYRIKSHNPATFVVMATASDYADDKEEANFNRVDGFLTKPFGKQKIDEIIDRFWATRSKP